MWHHVTSWVITWHFKRSCDIMKDHVTFKEFMWHFRSCDIMWHHVTSQGTMKSCSIVVHHVTFSEGNYVHKPVCMSCGGLSAIASHPGLFLLTTWVRNSMGARLSCQCVYWLSPWCVFVGWTAESGVPLASWNKTEIKVCWYMHSLWLHCYSQVSSQLFVILRQWKAS